MRKLIQTIFKQYIYQYSNSIIGQNHDNDDNKTDGHSNPVTVTIKRILKKIESKNLKNGFQEFLRKSLDKMGRYRY